MRKMIIAITLIVICNGALLSADNPSGPQPLQEKDYSYPEYGLEADIETARKLALVLPWSLKPSDLGGFAALVGKELKVKIIIDPELAKRTMTGGATLVVSTTGASILDNALANQAAKKGDVTWDIVNGAVVIRTLKPDEKPLNLVLQAYGAFGKFAGPNKMGLKGLPPLKRGKDGAIEAVAGNPLKKVVGPVHDRRDNDKQYVTPVDQRASTALQAVHEWKLGDWKIERIAQAITDSTGVPVDIDHNLAQRVIPMGGMIYELPAYAILNQAANSLQRFHGFKDVVWDIDAGRARLHMQAAP